LPSNRYHLGGKTEEQRANIKKVLDDIFPAFDKDKDGYLTFDEFKGFIDKSLEPAADEKQSP